MTSMIEDGSAARTADDRRASREIIGRIVDAASTNRGRLPMLDSIFERFEFMITGAFRQLTAVHIESSAPTISSGPFSQIVDALPVPCFSGIAKVPQWDRSEEHTSELQSLMRNSYAVFCLKKKKNTNTI